MPVRCFETVLVILTLDKVASKKEMQKEQKLQNWFGRAMGFLIPDS